MLADTFHQSESCVPWGLLEGLLNNVVRILILYFPMRVYVCLQWLMHDQEEESRHTKDTMRKRAAEAAAQLNTKRDLVQQMVGKNKMLTLELTRDD